MLDRVAAHRPYVAATLSRHPELFQPLFAKYLDTRFSMLERFTAIAHDLEFTAPRVRKFIPDFLPSRSHATLYECDAGCFSIRLSLNAENPQEGLWRLTLFYVQRVPVYFVCFSILPGPRLFIGAIQGADRGTNPDRLATIRAATKYFAGLRPPYLLLSVLRQLAVVWDIASIIGVSDGNQLTAQTRPNKRPSLHFSYDRFFIEARATRSACGNWILPVMTSQRTLKEAPNRKRAMYRRRHLLLEELNCRIAATLRWRAMDPE